MRELKIATSVGQAALRYYAFQHSALCRERARRPRPAARNQPSASLTACDTASSPRRGLLERDIQPEAILNIHHPPTLHVKGLEHLMFTMMESEALHFVSRKFRKQDGADGKGRGGGLWSARNCLFFFLIGGSFLGCCALRGDVSSAASSAPCRGKWRVLHSEREILHLTSMVTDATPSREKQEGFLWRWIFLFIFFFMFVSNAHQVMCHQTAGLQACMHISHSTPPI